MNLFVYGTLQMPEIQECICGRRLPSEPAVLPGFAVRRVEGASFPGVFRCSGEETPGLVLRDLSPGEIASFDAYEDSFYRRTSVEVVLEGGRRLGCDVYEVPREIAEEILTEQTWDLEWFRANAARDYLERLRGSA